MNLGSKNKQQGKKMADKTTTKKKPTRTTKKKQVVIGKQEYMHPITGVIEQFNVIRTEDCDFNFEKVWLNHLCDALDIIGNKKVTVMNWMLKNRNNENQILGTQRDIAKRTKVSTPIVNETLKMLIGIKAIKKVQNGIYQLNPEIMFKGHHGKRMNILLQYEKPEIHEHEKDENQLSLLGNEE